MERLERLNVGCLPTLRPLNYSELHSLTLLKALEATRVDCRVMGEHIFAILTADEAKSLGIVKPLHYSLFHRIFLTSHLLPSAVKFGGLHLAKTNLFPASCSHISILYVTILYAEQWSNCWVN